MTEIIDLIPKDIRDKWDGYDYEILPPATLDSESALTITLINRDESVITVEFGLHEGVELTYKIAVTWEVFGEVEIKASSLEKALDKAEEDDEIPLPEANYVDGSFKIDREMSKHLNKGL